MLYLRSRKCQTHKNQEHGSSNNGKEGIRLDDGKIRCLGTKVELLKHKANGKRLNQWLTGPEVCQQLRISPRTLQKLRDRRFLGHTQFGRQFYYKPDEVKALVPLIARIKSV